MGFDILESDDYDWTLKRLMSGWINDFADHYFPEIKKNRIA